MKGFARSIAGKTLSFIMTIVSTCALLASIALAAVLVALAQSGVNFYILSEQEALERLEKDMVVQHAYYAAWSYAQGIEAEENRDVSYRVRDEAGEAAYVSLDARGTDKWAYSYRIGVTRDANGGTDVFLLEDGASAEGVEWYWIDLLPKENGELANKCAMASRFASMAYRLKHAVFWIAGCSLLGLIVFFVMLMSASGRSPLDEDIHPGPLNKVPYDVMLCLCGGLTLAGLAMLMEISNEGMAELAVAAVPIGLLILNVLLGLCVSTAARLKQRTLLKNTVAFFCLRVLWQVFLWMLGVVREAIVTVFKAIAALYGFNMEILRNLPIVWKTLAFLAVAAAVELALIMMRDVGAWLMMWAAGNALLIPFALFLALTLRRLQSGGAALAEGDLSYHIDTRGMPADFKKHGENLNSIAYGMTLAVDERMKSEHMKTELIANVSHDIKTPLTSIINYASLIANETCDNEKIKEYAEVLVRQSQKLKKLLEDVVEASKASTGNLDVVLAPCDPSLFLMQAAGEYEDKMNENGLTLIVKQCSEELQIMADGRRMWRIFDNLMNNICKYAQPGTRVYMTLEKAGDNAVITFKNTSREELDMSEEELMERFTRGDDSRNTEGNGLGLSIARSIAQLQNGELHLSIDGDLFKAILSFPLLH